MRRICSIFGVVTGLFTLLVVGGCSGQRAAFEKQIAGLEDDLVVLQSSNARLEERVAALELEQKQSARPRADQAEKEEDSVAQRPELQVVRLGPNDEDGGESAAEDAEPSPGSQKSEEEANRPLIHGSGDRLETKMPVGPTSSLAPAGRASRHGLDHTVPGASEPLTEANRA